MSSGKILAVRVGRSIDLTGASPIRTAYRKHRVAGRVRVLREGLEGDEQAHREAHGGPDRAVLAYSAAHYRAWGAEDIAAHGFGENLVVEGLDEETVCIGDVFAAGSAALEVSVPRTPCNMISRATAIEGLFERVRDAGRTGWLHRVLEEGELGEGDELVLRARPNAAWTVTRAARVMERMRAYDAAIVTEARELAALGALAIGWREKLRRRADATERGEVTRDETR